MLTLERIARVKLVYCLKLLAAQMMMMMMMMMMMGQQLQFVRPAILQGLQSRNAQG